MKNSCFIFFIFFLFGSCQRNDIETLNGPFFSYLNRNGVSIDTVANAAKFWEYGFQFKSLKLQTMNGVGIKVPAIGIFKVKLYDLILGKLLLDTVVNSFITNQETYININEIKLVENGVFGIAIVADVFLK
ncbi:MAG: hypothetical protein IPH93_15015 [Saprospiraceae bacterium]|nr:hypothetical protein [Saprospiraceae bacterium]